MYIKNIGHVDCNVSDVFLLLFYEDVYALGFVIPIEGINLAVGEILTGAGVVKPIYRLHRSALVGYLEGIGKSLLVCVGEHTGSDGDKEACSGKRARLEESQVHLG